MEFFFSLPFHYRHLDFLGDLFEVRVDLMLTEAEDEIAHLDEFLIDFPIPLSVPFDLGLPEASVRLELSVDLDIVIAMKKIAVAEETYPIPGQDDVRTSRKAFDVLAIAIAPMVERPSQSEFDLRVLSFDPGHHLARLGRVSSHRFSSFVSLFCIRER